MAGSRGTTPLFDLLSRPSAQSAASRTPAEGPAPVDVVSTPSPAAPSTPSKPAKPVVRMELKPRPEHAAADSRSPVSATVTNVPPPSPPWYAGLMGTVRVAVPQNLIYLMVAVFMGLCIASYSVGFRNGEGSGREEFERFRRDLPIVNEVPDMPAGGGLAANSSNTNTLRDTRTGAAVATPPPARPPAQGGTTPRPTSTPQPATGAVITTKGLLSGDPREVGLNYLALAVLSYQDASAAVSFLAQNGVESFAVPVDPKSFVENNRGPTAAYRLYAGAGFKGSDLSKSAAQTLEAEVARLGQVWSRQHRGPSDFRKPGWRKYSGN